MKTKKQTAFRILLVFISVVALGILMLYVSPLSYLYCVSRESSWLKATNEKDMESRLGAFYTKRAISPGVSSWGRDHVMKNGQRMTQYLIFNKEPLDVVYNADDTVDTVYTSYE